MRTRLAHLRFVAQTEDDELPLRDPIGMLGEMLAEARERYQQREREEALRKESEAADAMLASLGLADLFKRIKREGTAGEEAKNDGTTIASAIDLSAAHQG